MSDALSDGRKMQVLYVVHNCNQEARVIDLGVIHPAKVVEEILGNFK